MKEIIPFKKRLGLNLFAKYRKVESSLHELKFLFWECTLRCNLTCLHCGSDCHKDSNTADMKSEDFLKVAGQIAKSYNAKKIFITITGGEPLLRKDLEFCGNELHKLKFPWGIVSNGYSLSENRLVNLIKSGMKSITISLDGLEKSHNWLRNNKNSFKNAVNSIKLIAKSEVLFDVITCVNDKNFVELDSIKELLIKLGVKQWRIFTIFPQGRASKHQELDLDSKYFEELMKYIVKTNKEGKIKTIFSCEGFLGNYENEARDGFYFCRAGINVASIHVDGSIGSCLSVRHEFIQGNIYKDNFCDIWENKFQKLRNRNWTKVGICKDCKEYKWCEGNGLHLWTENGELMRCDYKGYKA